MERALTRTGHKADDGHLLMHEWRLTWLGISRWLAQAAADRVDWHQLATLVRRGCPPQLALRIVG